MFQVTYGFGRFSPFHALLVTEEFADGLKIGTQLRPDLFPLNIDNLQVLYRDVSEARGTGRRTARNPKNWTNNVFFPKS